MSVTVALTEADFQPWAQAPVHPKGFEVYRLTDDQAGDASGGNFTFDINFNQARSAEPGYWSIIQAAMVGTGASFTDDVYFALATDERWEKFERFTQSDKGIFSLGIDTTTANVSTPLARDLLANFPFYLGQPLMPAVNAGVVSQGTFKLRTNNVTSCQYGLWMVMARADRPISWPRSLIL